MTTADIKHIATRCLRIAKVGWTKSWRWYKGLYTGTPWYKKAIAGFLSLIALFVFYLVAVNINLFWLFGQSPSVSEIMNPVTNEASILYSSDGKLLGKYFNENRTPV